MIDLGNVKKQFEENQGFWFDYPEDKDVKIKIRPLFPEKSNQLNRKATQKNHAGAKELNQDKLSVLILHYVIEDWKGISINGSNECTDEAKEMIGLYHNPITKFALAKSNDIASIISSQDEEQLKNLQNLLELS
jgi:hypothetical protein